jgi:hypothetical protein
LTDYFVRSSDGNNADSGLSWALAKADLAAALGVCAAGDTIYVSDNHAESIVGANSFPSPGTAGNYVRILCVDDAGDPASPTTLATTATVSTTGAANMTLTGFAYCYGITFSAGSGANNASFLFTGTAAWGWLFDNCTLKMNGTGGSARFDVGVGATTGDEDFLHLINTPLHFSSTSQAIRIRNVRFVWEHTASALPGTVPTTLFTPDIAIGHTPLIKGVDLSAAGSGKSLVSLATGVTALYRFRNCKLGASVAITTGTPLAHGGTEVEVLNCDSTDSNYRHERHEYNGTQVISTTIYRSGGASDGTTPLSWQITGARTQRFMASFTSLEMTGWVNSTGSKTFTVHYIHGESAALQDDQIWLKVDYLGSGSFPISSVGRDRKADILATAANQAADTSADWDNGATARANSTAYSLGDIRRSATPGGKLFVVTTAGTSAGSEPAGFGTSNDGDSITDNTVTWRQMRREKLEVTVTVNELGPVVAVVELAANVTVYVDPLLEGGETATRQYVSPLGGYMNETGTAASGGGIRLAGSGGLAA